MTIEVTETPRTSVPCPRCAGLMRSGLVKTAIWREERLFIVEDIPAQVCDSCMEQFYDEDTSDALRRLTEEGFSSVTPRRELLVPIFSLEDRIPKRTPSRDEVVADY